MKAARVVFAALVVATFGAFFVAQRLKHGPTIVQKFSRDPPVFSPNRDGRKDRANFRFVIKDHDDVTVDLIDTKGDRVKRMADNRALAAYTGLILKWDGRTDGGAMAPDGSYRVRITLRRAGRTVIAPKSFRKDTKAPAVEVTSVGPTNAAGPELLPNADGHVTINFSAPARRKRITIFRTYPGPVTRVLGPDAIADDSTSYDWDGTRRGVKVRPGAYVAVVEAQDTAGNVGTSVPVRRASPERPPLLPFGARLPGRGGITVRYLGVQPPVLPLPAGRSAEIPIDARGAKVQWSLRRAGGSPRPIRRSGGLVESGPRVKVPVPSGESGLYLLTVRSGSHVQQVVLPARASTPHRVLVVLPALTWAGRNPADDDGDGAVNTVDRGRSALLSRIMIGDGSGLPLGLTTHEAPVLAWLDREHHRYDLTTDAALAADGPPRRIDGYAGILLVGDTRWLTPKLGARLRRYVRSGGALVSLGTESLRAQLSLSKGGRLVDATALDTRDLFGATLAPIVRGRPTTLVGGSGDTDKLQLFTGGTGEITDVRAYEVTRSLGRELRPLSEAVAQDGEKVIVGARFGRGTVIRTGLPDLGTRLRDRNTAELLGRVWTLLSH